MNQEDKDILNQGRKLMALINYCICTILSIIYI